MGTGTFFKRPKTWLKSPCCIHRSKSLEFKECYALMVNISHIKDLKERVKTPISAVQPM